MWMCPKCSKQISDGSKICRECGAILEEVEDHDLTEGDSQSDLSGQSGQASATEEEQPSPVQAGSSTDMPQEDEDPVETYDEQDQQEQAEALPWTCKKCGEHVPETFTVCWNCGTTIDGLEAPDFVKEDSDGGDTVQPDAGSAVEPRTDVATTARCRKCDSSKIIPDVTVIDQGQGSDGKLKVVVYGNPEALVFRDRHFGAVTARICGDCGFIELWVRNPHELYEHYLKSLGQ